MMGPSINFNWVISIVILVAIMAGVIGLLASNIEWLHPEQTNIATQSAQAEIARKQAAFDADQQRADERHELWMKMMDVGAAVMIPTTAVIMLMLAGSGSYYLISKGRENDAAAANHRAQIRALERQGQVDFEAPHRVTTGGNGKTSSRSGDGAKHEETHR